MLRLLFFIVCFFTAAAAIAAPDRHDDPIKKIIEDALNDPRVYEALEQARKQETSVDLKLVEDDKLADESISGMGNGKDTNSDADTKDASGDTASGDIKVPTPAPTPGAAMQPSFQKGFQASSDKKEEKVYNYLGAMLDLGLPDGIGLSFVFRPWHWLRMYVSGTHNIISFGVRGGLSVVPFKGPVSPSVTFEAGHQFEGDANWIAQQIVNDSTFQNASLKRVSYNYLNGHLGMEFGTDNLTFFVHGGVSYVYGTIHDFQKTLEQTMGVSASRVAANDPSFYFFGPSGKLGAVYYFW